MSASEGEMGGDGDSLRSSPANLTSMLEDISLLQQSHVDVGDETLNTSTLQTYGLEDLSCSLVHCNGAGDFDEDAVKFCEEIAKKDELILSLYNALKKLTKQRQEGEQILSSVEHQVRYVHKVLKSRPDLQPGDSAQSNLSPSVPDGKCLEPNYPVVIFNGSPNHNSQTLEDLKHKEEDESNSCHQINQGNKASPLLSNPSKNDDEHSEKDNPRDEHSDEPSNTSQLPTSFSQLFIPINPESMRLTYSPTICEYEAEGLNTSGEQMCHQTVIDDLTLQLADRDRKLESTKKYLSEMTMEREAERDEFQHTIEELIVRCEELKKDKERSDKMILQQKIDLEDTMENLVATNRLKDDIIRRSQSSENELKVAVDKICELREIIRNLEEQVEDATKQVAMYSEIKRGYSEDLHNAQEEIKSNSDFICSPQNEFASVLEYTDELHVQVMELSRKVEEKLVEMENFPWQGRPESSCSMKSGDDVSVRTNAKPGQVVEFTGQDFFSRLSQWFRRLECNFDRLICLEEVLLKKVSDAELKFMMEHCKIEEISLENTRLRNELDQCRRKITDFECFINESSHSNSSRQYETMRNVGHSFVHRMDDCSPAIKRHRSQGVDSELDGYSEAEDYVDVEEVPHVAPPVRSTRTSPAAAQSANPGPVQSVSARSPQSYGPTSEPASISKGESRNVVRPNTDARNDEELFGDEIPGPSQSASARSQRSNGPSSESASALNGESTSFVPQNPGAGYDEDELFSDDIPGPTQSASAQSQRSNGPNSESASALNGESTSFVPQNPGAGNDEDELFSDDIPDPTKSASARSQGSNGPSSESASASALKGETTSFVPQNRGAGNDEDDCEDEDECVCDDADENIQQSQTGYPEAEDCVDVEEDEDECDDEDEAENIQQKQTSYPYQNIPGFQRDPSGFGNGPSNQTNRPPEGNYFVGPSGMPANRGLVLATDVQLVDNDLQGGQRLASDNPNVILHELTTVSEFEVEGGDVRYLGSHIIPAAELGLDPQGARDSRIDSVSDKVELEKMKTRLNMTQAALEEEKRISDQLYRQLNQIAPYNGPTNAVNSAPDQHVRALEYALDEKGRTESALRRNVECAMAAIQNLQDENQGLRDIIHDLENDLQLYVNRMQP